jgi:GNAT superfamily N-acetyltransferase
VSGNRAAEAGGARGACAVAGVSWPAGEVLRASAAWVSRWFPPDAVHVDLGWLEFYVADGAATVMRVVPGDMPAAELAGRVLGELRGRRVAEAFWSVGPGFVPEGAGRVLLALGAGVDRTIDICAYPLGGLLPGGPLPGAVTARPVLTRQDAADYERASAAAWGYRQPSDADIDRTFAALAPGCFTGYWDKTPAGAGGYTLAGEVARLWGAGVVPAFRGRGVYRALVRARLAQASGRGAALALVHAEPTSSPVLRRLGFRVYGQRQVLALGRALAAARP